MRVVREVARGPRMGLIRRLVDRWRHPGETPTMRAYRRWRDGTGRGEPYRLSAVGPVTDRVSYRIGDMAYLTPTGLRTYMARQVGPTVGVRMEGPYPAKQEDR